MRLRPRTPDQTRVHAPLTPSRLLMCFALLVGSLAAPPHAQASWSAFTNVGTATGIGNPSCAQASAQHVACAVLNGKSMMMVNEFSAGKWGTWKALTGTVMADPSCTSDGNEKVFCAATTTAGGLEVAILTGTTWSTPTELTAALFSAPSCAEYIAGEVLCVARNATAGLAWTLYSAGKWSPFTALSTTAVSAPSCTSDHESGVICSYYTVGGQTLVDRFVGGSWKGVLNIGGIGGGLTNCSFLQPNGEVACFAKATENGSLYVSTFNGGTWTAGNWTTYGNLGGTANDNVSCTTQSTGDLVCGVLSPIGNNEFYSNTYSSNRWSGWAAIGGRGVGSPSCTPYNTGKVLCLLMGVNNELTSVVGP